MLPFTSCSTLETNCVHFFFLSSCLIAILPCFVYMFFTSEHRFKLFGGYWNIIMKHSSQIFQRPGLLILLLNLMTWQTFLHQVFIFSLQLPSRRRNATHLPLVLCQILIVINFPANHFQWDFRLFAASFIMGFLFPITHTHNLLFSYYTSKDTCTDLALLLCTFSLLTL